MLPESHLFNEVVLASRALFDEGRIAVVYPCAIWVKMASHMSHGLDRTAVARWRLTTHDVMLEDWACDFDIVSSDNIVAQSNQNVLSGAARLWTLAAVGFGNAIC
jgi:hypothetical protein